MLTGEGADEVFAGYDIFREARVRMFWLKNADSELRRRTSELLYPWMRRSPGAMPAMAHQFFRRALDQADSALSHRPRWNATSQLKHLLTPAMREEAFRIDGSDLIEALPTGNANWSSLSRAQWFEMTTLLAGYILSSQGERMAMANSIECRFPYLDERVVQRAASLPAHEKLFGLEEKYALKIAFAELVPETIAHRPKQPVRAPDASSFFTPEAEPWFSEITSTPALEQVGVFDPPLVGTQISKCARTKGFGLSNTDNMRLLAIVSTQLVHYEILASPWEAAGRLPPPTVAIDNV